VPDNKIALDASILSTPSKPARGIPSVLPMLKEVSFNTSELIYPVTSLLALELGTPAIEMLAQKVKLCFYAGICNCSKVFSCRTSNYL